MSDGRPDDRRWRNRHVRLAVLGAAGTALVASLGGCSRVGYQRNVYKDDLDCAADYSADVCRRLGLSDGRNFLGPVYRTFAGTPKSCHSLDPGGGRYPANERYMLTKNVMLIERGGFGTKAIEDCDGGHSRLAANDGSRSGSSGDGGSLTIVRVGGIGG